MSFTITLTGRGPIFEAEFFPPIDISDGSYELGLVDFQSFHSIANVDSSNNKFYYDKDKVIVIPRGSYEIEAINAYLQEHVSVAPSENVDDAIYVRANTNTLNSELKCKYSVDLRKPNNIGSLLGFSSNRVIKPGQWVESDTAVKIIKINILRIACSITSGAYTNVKPKYVVHEFVPNVPSGYKISETPSNVIYLPVIVRVINFLSIQILDQNDRHVDFGEEEITVRLHIRKC